MRLPGHQHTEIIKYSPVVCYLLKTSLQSKENILCLILGFTHFRHFQN